MNLRYEIVENYLEKEYYYLLIVHDENNNITTYKYTNNIIKILENDNIIELLNRHIKVYDNLIKHSLLITKLSTKKEKLVRDYLYNRILEVSMESFELINNSQIKNELDDEKINTIYNFKCVINDVKKILIDAKKYSEEYKKVKKLVKNN